MRFITLFCKHPLNQYALYTLLFILIFAVIGPWLRPYSYFEIHLHLRNLPPSFEFWFGTDELGRDLFTRIWWGARISLFIGFAAALIDGILGIAIGSLAGYFGGKVDEAIMRFCDILYAIPTLLIVILLSVVRGTGLTTILIAMALTGWINMARIVRAQILKLKQENYVIAAEIFGASPFRILKRHLLPNAMGPILATISLTIPTAIFTEAFLSFIGLGVQAPSASWGVMANDGLSAMLYYPWRLLFPSIFITLTMLSFNILGNGLRDALDPKCRGIDLLRN